MSDVLGADLLDCNCSIPDPQLVRRIVSQVEFYLSDENLAKDAFLLKHVQKNKMGFVSIKLLTSFKKVGSPWRRPARVGSGLHVEGVWVRSGCLWWGVWGGSGSAQAACVPAKRWWCRAGLCSLPSMCCSSSPTREGGWGSSEQSSNQPQGWIHLFCPWSPRAALGEIIP